MRGPPGTADAEPAERRMRRMRRQAMRQLCAKLLSVRTHLARRQLRRYRAQEHAQHARLQRLVTHCVTYVPYYRSACAGLGGAADVRFADLPILDKAALRENFAELVAVGRAGAVLGGTPLWITRTSGSTGVPASYLKSDVDLVANNAALAGIFADYGVRPYGHLFDLGLHRKDQQVVEARAVPGWFVCWNVTGYSFDHPSLREECLLVAWAARPRVVYGAPSRLLPFARLCESECVRLRPTLVISTYEHLSAAGEALLARVFGCPVVQVYGTSETGPVAWTCREGTWHFDPRLAAAELVDDSGAYVSPGETGRLLITPLDVRVMPLLRFDTGDLAVAPRTACACGKAGPCIERLDGRRASLLETARGDRYSPFAVLEFVDALGVPESQIIQHRPGELTVVVPAGSSISADVSAELRRRICHYLGEDTDVRIRRDGRFVHTTSGKRNAYLSLVPSA